MRKNTILAFVGYLCLTVSCAPSIVMQFPPLTYEQVAAFAPPPSTPCSRTSTQVSSLQLQFQSGLDPNLQVTPSHLSRGLIPGNTAPDYSPMVWTLSSSAPAGTVIQEIQVGLLAPPPGCPPIEADFINATAAAGPIEIVAVGSGSAVTLPATLGPGESWTITFEVPSFITTSGRVHLVSPSSTTVAYATFKRFLP